MKDKIAEFQRTFGQADSREVLSWAIDVFQDKITFSTSLGAEDQVITHMISSLGRPVRIFTLDTGRLFQETYDLLDITKKKYGFEIEVLFPDHMEVESMVNRKGINLFYESIENRRMCCGVRKAAPLRRALEGMEVWVTGMRQDQSVTRAESAMFEWDEPNQVVKLNPLIYWSNDQVWSYIRENHVPVNDLHNQGYPSIGCLPCTRPVNTGEDIRAGRWWWELPQYKECGLHK